METAIRLIITVLFIALIAMALIFFGLFGVLPIKRLSQISKRPTSTPEMIAPQPGVPTIFTSGTVVSPVIITPTAPLNYAFFSLTLNNDKFSPNTIKARVGDNIQINLDAVDKTYTITIPDFGLSQTVKPGQKKLLGFQAVSSGEFKILCSSCGDFQGTLIVLPE